jgi:cytosine/adenosine deaminase-related metal-dependent hydrolase
LELLVTGGTVLTMNTARAVVRGDVLVRDGTIAHVGPGAPTPEPGAAREVLDAAGAVVVPGLIQGHLHLCQTLFRNAADGRALLDWLRDRIWPLEAAHDEASLRASALLGIAELVRSGATAALDMGTVNGQDAIFSAAEEAGFRLTSGKAMMDAGRGVPKGLKETRKDSVDASLRLLGRWHGSADGRLRYAFCPRFALSCSEGLLRDVAAICAEREVTIHTHAAENADECAAVKKATGKSNVEYLHALRLTGRKAAFAHCVHLSARERKILADSQTTAVHCPSANLKLASGTAPVPETLGAGMRWALGADGAACNNRLDIWEEMRLAALVHLPRVGPAGLSAQAVFEMATLGGARALGQERRLGSLEPGKRGDLAVVELSSPHAQPAGDDLYGTLVYSARASDVRHTVIDGRIIMRDRGVLTFDAPRAVAVAVEEARRVLARAGTGTA